MQKPKFLLVPFILLAICKFSIVAQESLETSNNSNQSTDEKKLVLKVSEQFVKKELAKFRSYLKNEVFLHRSDNAKLSKEASTFLFEVKERIESIQTHISNLKQKGITFTQTDLAVLSQLKRRIQMFENPGDNQLKSGNKPVLSDAFNTRLKSVMATNSLDERISMINLIVADPSNSEAEKKVAKEMRMTLLSVRAGSGDIEKAIQDAQAIGKKGVPVKTPKDLVLEYTGKDGKAIKTKINKGDILLITKFTTFDDFPKGLFWVKKVNENDSKKGWIAAREMLVNKELDLRFGNIGDVQLLTESDLDKAINQAKKELDLMQKKLAEESNMSPAERKALQKALEEERKLLKQQEVELKRHLRDQKLQEGFDNIGDVQLLTESDLDKAINQAKKELDLMQKKLAEESNMSPAERKALQKALEEERKRLIQEEVEIKKYLRNQKLQERFAGGFFGGEQKPVNDSEPEKAKKKSRHEEMKKIIGKPRQVHPKTLAGMESSSRTGKRQYDFTWSFDKEKFKITGAEIPTDLYEDILGKKTDSAEIVGTWEIRGQTIFLRTVNGEKSTECKMKIFNTGVVRIESSRAQYVFHRLLGGRERALKRKQIEGIFGQESVFGKDNPLLPDNKK